MIKMGRIKQFYLKRIADRLMTEYSDEFSTSFENNKKKVQELTDGTSKVIRNKIAGYITRVIKHKSVVVE